jgi:hypothetical protein
MEHWNRMRSRSVKLPLRLAIVLFTGAIACSCGSSSSGSHPPVPTGGVNGHVLAGPTCPAERPGDPACQPKAVTGSVRFAQGDGVVASIRIDRTGAFAIRLPPGSYTVTVDTGESVFPVCKPVDVMVTDGAFALIDINCDTGIR